MRLNRSTLNASLAALRRTMMRSTPARNDERMSGGKSGPAIGRPSPHGEGSPSKEAGLSNRSDIYRRPDLYDMEYAGASNEDAHFFARLVARVRPRRVLELACGSGRVTLTLAAALQKAEIVGVDSSTEMLGRATTACDVAESAVRQRVSFVNGDMRDWPGSGGTFDAVLITCCSVSHLLTLDDRRRTWATAFRLLRPGAARSLATASQRITPSGQ